MSTRRQSADATLTTVILMLVTAALLTVTTGLWAMVQLEQFGPSVGGIIVFRIDSAPAERWSVQATFVETGVGLPTESRSRHCAINPSVMAGGSMVIEARRMSRPPVFRVHWIGGHTDITAHDCGVTADLMPERTDLMRLANVAGGFSSGPRLIGP